MKQKVLITIVVTLIPMVLDALDGIIKKATKKDDLDRLHWINVTIKELIEKLFERMAEAEVRATALNDMPDGNSLGPDFDEAQGSPVVV